MDDFPDVEEWLGFTWLRTVLDTKNVDTALTSDLAKLRQGFCTITKAGDSFIDTSVMRAPVYEIECHVAPATDQPGQPPWGRASGIANRISEIVRYQERRRASTTIDIPDYGEIRVSAPRIARTPRRQLGDLGGNAVYTLDLILPWRRA